MAKLSRTAAVRKATDDSGMYRQGSGWIVSTLDVALRRQRLTEEMEWNQARLRLRNWRVERSLVLLGWNVEEVRYVCLECPWDLGVAWVVRQAVRERADRVGGS